MKEIPVHVVVLHLARDPDVAEDDPINWNWGDILSGLDGVHNPHFVTGGVLGTTNVPDEMPDEEGASWPDPVVTDVYGREWPMTEHCPTCGQPDNCGDCSHAPLGHSEAHELGAINISNPDQHLHINLSPRALREMFEDEEENPITNLDDEALREIAEGFLDGLVWRDIRSFVRETAESLER